MFERDAWRTAVGPNSMMASEMLRAYVETSIVSGIARRQLPDVELDALTRVLQAMAGGKVELITSQVVRDEIGKIPDQHRRPHEDTYDLLAKVPLVATVQVAPRFAFLGRRFPPGWREDRLFSALSDLLPDPPDVEHTFQAAKNRATHLVTWDYHTLLRFSEEVASLCGVKLVTPSEFDCAMQSAAAV